MKYLKIYLIFCFVGFILEGVIGCLIDLIFGSKLWVYQYGNIGGYMSFYAIPIWGLAAPVTYWVWRWLKVIK